MRWKQTDGGDWHLYVGDPVLEGYDTSEYLEASPVGEEARRLALLQCVPPGTTVPGVGRRLSYRNMRVFSTHAEV